MHNYTKTYYEIIDSNPKILESRIPLIELAKKIVYYLLSPFSILYYIFTRRLKLKQLVSKKEITDGRENNKLASHFHNNKEFSFPKDKVLKTISTYYSKRESKALLPKLIKEGFYINLEDFSSSYTIKKREEMIESVMQKDSETLVLVTYPKLALTINKIFQKINL